MGGLVAVTIRRENGEIIKMARKTGSYTSLFMSKEFSEGDFDKAIDNYIATFMDMRADFQSGPPYKYQMTPHYGWCDQLAPADYGLVVIDFKDKKIYSMQDYDYPGTSYFASLYASENEYITGQTLTESFSTHEVLPVYKLLKCPIDVSREELTKIVKSHTIGTEYILYDKNINLFNRRYFEKTANNIIAYFLELKEAGFFFNVDEKTEWKEFCHNYLENELESMDDDAGDVDEVEYFKKVNLIE